MATHTSYPTQASLSTTKTLCKAYRQIFNFTDLHRAEHGTQTKSHSIQTLPPPLAAHLITRTHQHSRPATRIIGLVSRQPAPPFAYLGREQDMNMKPRPLGLLGRLALCNQGPRLIPHRRLLRRMRTAGSQTDGMDLFEEQKGSARACS